MRCTYPALLLCLVLACDQRATTPPAQAIAPAVAPTPVVPAPPPTPYGIKKIFAGMTLKEFMAAKPNIYLTFMSDGVKCYTIKETIAGVKCEPICSFEDYGDGKILDRLHFSIKDYDYSSIRDAIIEKYGYPSKAEKVTKHNAMGASFHGEELEWRNSISFIRAEQVGSKVSESSFSFGYTDAKHRTSKEDLAKEKKKKDI
ncbi:hypothetical protein [Geothrix sp. 21YS21S-2]|uniref:hypothetical protein n=1 Tax=Geothrix sp. 21YS21S-2 TaxID=3068893 RepID=UPI0027B9D40B|nr:hypothetical protein [Geothrix sp. 21YS21S-2]